MERLLQFPSCLEARQKARLGPDADEGPNGAEQLAHDPENLSADRSRHPVRLPCLVSEIYRRPRKTYRNEP